MKKNKKPIYAATEFTCDLLPRNRKEQCKFILKTRKSLFVSLAVLLFAFAAPLLVVLGFKDYYIYNFYILYNAGNITETDFLINTAINNVIFTSICSGCLLIFSIALAGVLEIIKKLVLGRPIFLKHDLLHGVKNNILTCVILSLILGVFLILIAFAFRYMFFDVLFIVILAVFVLVIYPYFAGLYFYKTMYKSSFKQALYNGLFLYRAMGIKGLLLLLGLIVIPVASNLLAEGLIITGFVNLIITSIYFVVVLPVYLLILYCFYYSIFDVRLNKELFPDYYMSGLYNIDLPLKGNQDEKKNKE